MIMGGFSGDFRESSSMGFGELVVSGHEHTMREIASLPALKGCEPVLRPDSDTGVPVSDPHRCVALRINQGKNKKVSRNQSFCFFSKLI